MTIPFLGIFQRAKARYYQKSVPMAPPRRATPMEKPSGERLSKTVMPNTVRSSIPDPFQAAAETGANIKLPTARLSKLPPTVALALQPKVERAISLQLCDILDQLPAGYVKPAETFDTSRPVLLKASEIEKGMASGRPVVSLATIYAQVPEIFLRTVKPEDVMQVALPFNKVLDQFRNVQVRDDQEQESDVPQMDTPILQATLEDTQKFGTTLPAIQSSAHPPVRVEPATARAFSRAEPEPVLRETIAGSTTPRGIPLNLSTSPVVAPPRPSGFDPVSPTRIPFKLPPNGTDGSATETVPASSGPSVPTAPSPSASSARIPFKITPPCADLKPKLTLVPGVENAETETEEATAPVAAEVAKISLGLRTILQNMPAFQLTGSFEGVAEDVRIELPLSLVESQLAGGRIAVPVKTFRDALPVDRRELVAEDDAESPVLLPLQEVLKNLPPTVLKMRIDQEEVEVAALFETPFSIKAAEDAKRLAASKPVEEKKEEDPAAAKTDDPPEAKASETDKAAGTEVKTPEPPVAEKPEAKVEEEAKPETKVEEKAEPKVVEKTEVQAPATAEAEPEKKSEAKAEPKLEANTNAKGIVAQASALPGVGACSVTFEDGLSLAGNLPDDVQVGGLCAMAPSVLQRINRHTVDTKLGPLLSMTLHCRESQMSFYMKGSVCLTVLHSGGDLASETHHKLAGMASDLSRTYSQPETVHVDH